MRILPTFTDYRRFKYVVTLDGSDYELLFYWNSRSDCWYMSINDPVDETPILSGVRLNVLWDLLYSHRQKGQLPPGFFFVLDLSGDLREFEALEDFGERVKLVYLSEGEAEVYPGAEDLGITITTP